MQLFYGTEILGNTITLSEQESAHCARVLRMQAGDPIDVTDGNGNLYKGIIQIAHDKKTVVSIVSSSEQAPLPYRLHLYVGLTKHADRLEWMLEKCVEIGLSSFTPLLTHRTERKNIRIDRLESIALSAMKQSLKAWLPVIHPSAKLEHAVKNITEGTKLIAHCNEDPKKVALNSMNLTGHTHIFIGPEGDFTVDEVDLAVKNGVDVVSLGASRLRTETAGLMVCSCMYWYNINTQGKG